MPEPIRFEDAPVSVREKLTQQDTPLPAPTLRPPTEFPQGLPIYQFDPYTREWMFSIPSPKKAAPVRLGPPTPGGPTVLPSPTVTPEAPGPTLQPEKWGPAIGRFLTEGVRRGTFPVGLGLAGRFLGGRLPVPGGGTLGESLGSMAGLRLNQALGLESPQAADYITSGAFPFVGPTARMGTKWAPGSAGGFQEVAAEEIKKIPGKVAPKVSSEILYGSLPTGIRVPLTETSRLAQEILKDQAKVSPRLRNAADTKFALAADELATAAAQVSPTGGVPYDVFQANLTKYGQIARTERAGHATAARLFGAMKRDLDSLAASGSPLSQPLKEAMDAYKHELAVGELQKILGQSGKKYPIGKSTGFTVGYPTTQIDKAMTQIAQSKDLARWLSPEETTEILNALVPYSKLPQSVGYGRAGVEGMSLPARWLVGGALGGLLGQGAGSAAWGVIGTEALAQGLMSPVGRQLVKFTAQKGLPLDMAITAIGQLTRGGITGSRDAYEQARKSGVTLGTTP